MKKILVTGGSGFIGRNLISNLIKNKNNKIYCVDNLSTSSIKNINKFFGKKNFVFIKQDIRKKINIDVDIIYNLACPASPPRYQKNPLNTIDICYEGTKNLLSYTIGKNIKFFQASTSEIYGDPIIHPQKESYWGNVNPIGPRSCYDEGKRIAETLCYEFRNKFKTDVRIGRIFNTYGPFMEKNDGRVISNFINQALTNKDITIYGRGNQTRSFCYIDDTVSAIIKLMKVNKNFSPINIGNNNEKTIIDIARKIINLTNSKSEIVFHKLPKDDPMKRKPDIGLAKKTLSWTPKISLDEGLKKTIIYFKKINHAG